MVLFFFFCFVKTSLFISLCILRDLSQQKIPRELVIQLGEILLYFYVPMFSWKDFLMGQIKKIQKHKEERDRSGKFKKEKEKKEWRKEKEEIFTYAKGTIHVGSPLGGNALGLPPSCDPPS